MTESSGTISGFGGWLSRKSINQRLGIQATASIILSLILVSVLIGSSYMSQSMLERDDFLSEQALSSALLEKDFASLERDVFRYALLRNDATREDFEGNVADMRQAIADTRSRVEESEVALLTDVSSLTETYVETVTDVVSEGATGAAGAGRIMEAGDKVDAAIEAIRDPVIAKAEEHAALQVRSSKQVIWITIVIALLLGLISFILARSIRDAIASELGSISGAIGQILSGNYDVVIDHADRGDDVGELARAAVQLRNTSAEKRQAYIDMADMAAQLGECLKKMARGDLTVELGELSESYVGLRNDFNTATQQLLQTMIGVAETAHTIRTGSSEISQASDDLANRTESHASGLARTTEAVDQITAMVSETASGAAQARKDVSDAMTEAKLGSEVITTAVAAMSEIEQSTAQIEEIISVIDNIAFQTNLLALNAGVEAARAGAAGSGFAVVATEVRALAQRSADAAKDIKTLIERSSGQVSAGADMVRKTGDAFDRIVNKIEVATSLVETISAKTEEQSASLQEANKAMSGMDLVTQQNAAMVEESNAAARNLATEADNLAAIVSGFVLGKGEGGDSKWRPQRPASRPALPPAARSAQPQSVGNLALAADDWSEF